MAERAMKPATAGDLWFHIGRRAGQPVAAVAASWTDQPGVPLLEVAARCESGTTAVTLRQSRFALGEPLAGGPWLIPVRLARGSEQLTVLLQRAEQEFDLPGCAGPVLLANAGGLGYYRVDYDPALRERLLAGFPALEPGDRVALLSDSDALASAGRRQLAEHFALLAALPQVHDASRAALYTLALAHFRALEAAFDATPGQEALRVAGQALFGPELARLGWQAATDEDSETQSLRGELIRHLAVLRHAPTLAAARERFAAALEPQAGGVPPSIREAVIAAVGSDADDTEFDALLVALRATESQEERWVLVGALAAGRDPQRARRLLDEALSGRLPPDIAAALPGSVAAVPSLAALAYDFSVEHWEALLRLAGTGPFGGRHWLLPGAAGRSADPELARRLLEDQQRLDGTAGASSAETVAAAILVRHRLREREATALAAVLAGWAPR
jgi:aminopeptidase N